MFSLDGCRSTTFTWRMHRLWEFWNLRFSLSASFFSRDVLWYNMTVAWISKVQGMTVMQCLWCPDCLQTNMLCSYIQMAMEFLIDSTQTTVTPLWFKSVLTSSFGGTSDLITYIGSITVARQQLSQLLVYRWWKVCILLWDGLNLNLLTTVFLIKEVAKASNPKVS